MYLLNLQFKKRRQSQSSSPNPNLIVAKSIEYFLLLGSLRSVFGLESFQLHSLDDWLISKEEAELQL